MAAKRKQTQPAAQPKSIALQLQNELGGMMLRWGALAGAITAIVVMMDQWFSLTFGRAGR